MNIFHREKNNTIAKTINVDQIWTLVNRNEQLDIIESGNLPVVDCRTKGIKKVLGKGDILYPAIVIANQFTPEATKKIEERGGKTIISA